MAGIMPQLGMVSAHWQWLQLSVNPLRSFSRLMMFFCVVCLYAMACFVWMRLFQRPQIILLRDGTDTSQGIGQLISNINACQAIVETVRTTLGPRGMDKLIHSGRSVRMGGALRA